MQAHSPPHDEARHGGPPTQSPDESRSKHHGDPCIEPPRCETKPVNTNQIVRATDGHIGTRELDTPHPGYAHGIDSHQNREAECVGPHPSRPLAHRKQTRRCAPTNNACQYARSNTSIPGSFLEWFSPGSLTWDLTRRETCPRLRRRVFRVWTIARAFILKHAVHRMARKPTAFSSASERSNCLPHIVRQLVASMTDRTAVGRRRPEQLPKKPPDTHTHMIAHGPARG